MEMISFWNQWFGSVMGGWGSPTWWLVAACVVTIFFAKWWRAIRSLLPLIGAMTLIYLALWALTGMGVIEWHVK
jgi:predicted exporter